MSRDNYFFPLIGKKQFEGIVSKSTAALRRLLLLPSRFSAFCESLVEKLQESPHSPRGGELWWGCETRSVTRSK